MLPSSGSSNLLLGRILHCCRKVRFTCRELATTRLQVVQGGASLLGGILHCRRELRVIRRELATRLQVVRGGASCALLDSALCRQAQILYSGRAAVFASTRFHASQRKKNLRQALIAASARFQHIPIQSCQLRSLGESSQFEFEHLASVSSAMFIFPSVCPPGFIVVFARSHLAQSYPAPALHHSNRELAIAVPSAKQASSCEHLCECCIC